MRVLVLGASGYVGSRLVPALVAAGLDVTATYRSHERIDGFPWAAGVPVRQCDLLDRSDVDATVAGHDAVCYLVHGLGSSQFRVRDRVAAQHVRAAVDAAGVRRVVYLSGVVPAVDRSQLSEHLVSRLEVEQVLESSRASTLALRAAVVIGAGSTPFEIVRQLSHRLPLEPIPSWLETRVQPIAVRDAVHLLLRALDRPDITGHVDVGGPDVVTYPELLREFAALAGLHRVQVPAPPAPSALVGTLAGLVTSVPRPTVAALIASLQHDMICRDGDRQRLLLDPGHELLALRRALELSLSAPPPGHDGAGVECPEWPSAGDPPWATHPG